MMVENAETERLEKIKKEVFENYEQGKYDELITKWQNAVNDLYKMAKEIAEKVGGKDEAKALAPGIADSLSAAYSDVFETMVALMDIWEQEKEEEHHDDGAADAEAQDEYLYQEKIKAEEEERTANEQPPPGEEPPVEGDEQ
jgi:DNA-binding protein H-NS